LVKSLQSGHDTVKIVQNLTHWDIELIDIYRSTALVSEKGAFDEISIREEICTDMDYSSTCDWEGFDGILDGELFTIIAY
jgi:hypothetical protein